MRSQRHRIIADPIRNCVHRVTPDGTISRFAGTGVPCFAPCGDGGLAAQARLNNPSGLAVGPDGSLYIADTFSGLIRRVSPTGVITTVAGGGYQGDGGPATQAYLSGPQGVAIGPDGSLYIADTGENKVRRVAPNGIISTIAGVGGYCGIPGLPSNCYGGDGDPAGQAQLNGPRVVALGPDGSLYITQQYRVRRIGPDGVITTIAGNAQPCASPTAPCGDGGPASAAQFNLPDGLVVGYISDFGDNRVRRIGQDGTISGPGNGAITYGYDGALTTDITATGTISGSVHRGYDGDLRLYSQSVDGTNTITYGYDADGLMIGAGNLQLTRDPGNGLLTGTLLGSVADSSSYDGYVAVAAYTATAGSSPLMAASYTRDALGRISRKTETIAGATHTYVYGYDPAGRLQTVTADGNLSARYVYDANGNRTGVIAPTGSISATYDVQDRLLDDGAGTTYTYTAGGYLASKTSAAGTTHYVYDALGNLTGMTLPDGTRITYLVDGANRNIGKMVDGTLVQGFLYDAGMTNPVAQLDGTGHVVARFVYTDASSTPAYMIKGGTSYRIIADTTGSPRLVVNATTGAVAERIDYDAYGNVVTDTAPGFQPFGFGGGLHDGQTGLVRLGARDYDPQSGRWTGKDPILFGGGTTNLYGYALDDPINHVDPSGEIVPLVGVLVGGGVGAAANVIAVLATNDHVTGRQLAAAAVGGFVSGGIAVFCGAVCGAIGGAAGQLVSNWIDPCHPGSVINAAAFGALGNALAGAQFNEMLSAEAATGAEGITKTFVASQATSNLVGAAANGPSPLSDLP